jgi:hypothetical protein
MTLCVPARPGGNTSAARRRGARDASKPVRAPGSSHLS